LALFICLAVLRRYIVGDHEASRSRTSDIHLGCWGR
jgi:hypothetical protein